MGSVQQEFDGELKKTNFIIAIFLLHPVQDCCLALEIPRYSMMGSFCDLVITMHGILFLIFYCSLEDCWWQKKDNFVNSSSRFWKVWSFYKERVCNNNSWEIIFIVTAFLATLCVKFAHWEYYTRKWYKHWTVTGLK